ncbi:ABC transporter permease [Thioalkalicoccus limnaeus]|uniref:ABC transporter permease n=1 Tax=Thioalkalicoccus limnaeus TaxID=120681 RepID=UPI0034E9590A
MAFPWPVFRIWLRRDIKSRYAGSLAGLLWAVISPIATIALFYLLFAFIFQIRVPEIAAQSGFFFYLLAGLLPWLSIAEGLSRATGVIVGHEGFLQKQAFPVEVLPVTVVTASLVTQGVGTLVFVVLLWWAGILGEGVPWLWPLALIAQLAMTIGLGLALAVLAMHLRDLLHATPLVLQFLFYASPILYPMSMVPVAVHHLYLLNPFAVLVRTYHAAFLGLELPMAVLVSLGIWTLVLGGGGYLVFRTLKPTLGETL